MGMDTWVYNHPAVAGTVSIFNRYIGISHDWIALREIQGGVLRPKPARLSR